MYILIDRKNFRVVIWYIQGTTPLYMIAIPRNMFTIPRDYVYKESYLFAIPRNIIAIPHMNGCRSFIYTWNNSLYTLCDPSRLLPVYMSSQSAQEALYKHVCLYCDVCILLLATHLYCDVCMVLETAVFVLRCLYSASVCIYIHIYNIAIQTNDISCVCAPRNPPKKHYTNMHTHTLWCIYWSTGNEIIPCLHNCNSPQLFPVYISSQSAQKVSYTHAHTHTLM